jgi:hypothetical protein
MATSPFWIVQHGNLKKFKAQRYHLSFVFRHIQATDMDEITKNRYAAHAF